MPNARRVWRAKRGAIRALKCLRLGMLWRAISPYCRARRTLVGSGRRRWNARLGYALMHQDRLDEATAAYATAITGDPLVDNWIEIVRHAPADVCRGAVTPTIGEQADPRLSWFYRLGQRLQKQGELETAVTLTAYAYQRDAGKSRWPNRLARLHEHVGDAAGRFVPIGSQSLYPREEFPTW